MKATAHAISVHELQRRRAAGETLDLVDVRTPREFAAAHVAGARNVPLGSPEITAMAREHAGGDRPLVLICASGGRSRQCADALAAAGATHVLTVAGGTGAWAEAGLPLEHGERGTISLERQVRIAAGSLVLAGCVSGYLVHPGFYGLAAFAGAGLVFAGVSDFCGMGLLLARMPWNR